MYKNNRPVGKWAGPVGKWAGLCTEALFSTRLSSLPSLCFRFFVKPPDFLPELKD